MRAPILSTATVLVLANCSSLAKPSIETALVNAGARPPWRRAWRGG